MSNSMYHPGELRSLIRLDKPSRTPDGAGGFSRAWVKHAACFARVRPLTGRERLATDRVEATAGYHITIRARADLDETMTIVWGERRHNIRFIKARDPRSLYLEIETEQGVPV